MQNRLPLAFAASAFAVAVLGWTPIADAAREAVRLPRNSVGTVQLRTGAVNSAKIRNGGVTLADLARSARIAGPAGPAGPAGEGGPRGPSDLFAVRGTPPVAAVTSSGVLLARLTVPAGRYLISGRVWLSNGSSTGAASALCAITAGSGSFPGGARLDPIGGVNQLTVSIDSWLGLSAETELQLGCTLFVSSNYPVAQISAIGPELSALRVESINGP